MEPVLQPGVINYFLGGLGAILGPFFGIMMVDYYFVRHRRVVIEDLFRDSPSGAYYYRRGVNPRALWVFVPTVAISVFIALGPSLPLAAPFSWFIGAGLAAVAYYFAMRNHPSLAREGVTDVRRSEDVAGEHRTFFGEEKARPRFGEQTEDDR